MDEMVKSEKSNERLDKFKQALNTYYVYANGSSCEHLIIDNNNV